MTTVYSSVDELDEALATGNRALEIAERLNDLKLRLVTTSYLAQVTCYRGEYERVVELATKNIADLPPEWVSEHFGMAVPASIFDRAWLIMSLAELGRFAEAAQVRGGSDPDRRSDGTCLHASAGRISPPACRLSSRATG